MLELDAWDDSRVGGGADWFEEIQEAIAASPLDDLHRFLLANCVETYLELEGRDAEELESLLAARRF